MPYTDNSVHAGTPPHWVSVSSACRTEILNAIPAAHRLTPESMAALHDPRNVIGLPETCGVLSARELEITNIACATELLEAIRSCKYTAIEVTEAFCKRASVAHQVTNCLAEVLYEPALARARELDEHLAKTGEAVGPLHGLPISVKEHVHLKGTRSTSGFIAWVNHTYEEDALIVEVFRKAGAIFHVKTTNPLTLLSLETESNLYGRTLNPYNTDLTPGGSSGGESALIAMRGSLLGIGTDIGGSIRCPAGSCGLYGFKPSVARMPHGGLAGAHAGMDNIVGVVGPLALHIDDVELFCKVALDYQPWLYEPSLINVPWNSALATTGPGNELLTIGIMLSDGFVNPHPSITRCLLETRNALQKAGHKVVKWTPFKHKEINELIMNLYFLDGGNEYREIMKQGDEPLTDMISWILDSFEWKNLRASDTWKLNHLRDKYRTEYAHHWNKNPVDAILCPVGATAAALHTTSKYWGYTSVWNLLDYSSIVFPAGTVADKDGELSNPNNQSTSPENEEYTPMAVNQYISRLWFEKDEKGKIQGPERYRFAPVGLQLVARRYEEEKLVRILRRVLKAVDEARKSGPLTSGLKL